MNQDKRNAKRQPMRYTAWVALTADERKGCVISNVSDTGARIDVEDPKSIPDHFVLMLTSNGAARRFCRVMWRNATQVGVKFERSLAEAAGATSVSKAAANAHAAPPPDDDAAETQATGAATADAEPAKTA
ncbi:MAG: PilZ domain-containing protein [Pseudolabrys sp.]